MTDDKFYRISHDLRILSYVRENNRIFTENAKLKIDQSCKPISSLSRYINGQDRYKNVDMIQNLLDDTFLYIDSLLRLNSDKVSVSEKEKQCSIITRLKTLLIESINGIRSLRITYQHDASIKARLIDIEERIVRDLTSRGLFSNISIYSRVNAIENSVMLIEEIEEG